jgi:hypothetical protein
MKFIEIILSRGERVEGEWWKGWTNQGTL